MGHSILLEGLQFNPQLIFQHFLLREQLLDLQLLKRRNGINTTNLGGRGGIRAYQRQIFSRAGFFLATLFKLLNLPSTIMKTNYKIKPFNKNMSWSIPLSRSPCGRRLLLSLLQLFSDRKQTPREKNVMKKLKMPDMHFCQSPFH